METPPICRDSLADASLSNILEIGTTYTEYIQ